MPKATKWIDQLRIPDDPLDFVIYMRRIRNEDTTGDNPPDSSKIAPLPDDTKFRGLPLSVPLDTRNAVSVTPDGRAIPMHSPPFKEYILDIGFNDRSTIGEDVTHDSPIKIAISERRSGLYILGKPRMGKSWLMVNLILQDIEKTGAYSS